VSRAELATLVYATQRVEHRGDDSQRLDVRAVARTPTPKRLLPTPRVGLSV